MKLAIVHGPARSEATPTYLRHMEQTEVGRLFPEKRTVPSGPSERM